MSDTATLDDLEPTPFVDPAPPPAQPLILNDTYFELSGTNLRCLVKHIEVMPENKPVTITTFCAETDYPGTVKWHLKLTFAQSFDANATYATLKAALDAYNANGTPVPWKARPYSSRPVSANNPEIAGYAIPQEFELLMGDAGASSEVQIDWSCPAKPTVNTGAVAATGATAGAPGYFTPAGATVPANLAALASIAATPSSAWTTGQFVITADLLGAYWSGSAWVAGKKP